MHRPDLGRVRSFLSFLLLLKHLQLELLRTKFMCISDSVTVHIRELLVLAKASSSAVLACASAVKEKRQISNNYQVYYKEAATG